MILLFVISEVDLTMGVALLKCGMFLCSIPGGYLRRRPAGTEMATAIMVNIHSKVVRCGGLVLLHSVLCMTIESTYLHSIVYLCMWVL